MPSGEITVWEQVVLYALLMADREQGDSIPESTEAWFAKRGFGLAIRQLDGIFWADLLNAHGDIVAARYGRGGQATEAADSAMRRYLDEQ